MEADFAAFGSPLCGELKRFCKRVRETYREIREDLTPYKDDRYYRTFGQVTNEVTNERQLKDAMGSLTREKTFWKFGKRIVVLLQNKEIV